ncbi:MAG: DNA translocase FtsK [Clostridia bacterium]|nr:DNA translocase FtsK [Clostridia bacterium]
MIRLDFRKIFGQVKEKQEQRRAYQAQEDQHQRQQEMMWQQRQQEIAAQRALPPVQQGDGWDAYVPQGAYQQPVQQMPIQQQRQMRQSVQQPPRQQVKKAPVQVGFQPTEEEYAAYEQPAYQVKPEEAERKSKIFGRKKQAEEPAYAPEEPKRTGIFGGRKAQVAEPVAEEPVEEFYEEPVVKPARSTGQTWRENTQPQRTASWRSEEPVEDYQPARPVKKKQQPKPSWSETPPWEDAPVDNAAAVVAPKLQQEPPKDAWQPELKLPPRKNAPQGEQVEMELPPPYVFPGMNLLKPAEPMAGVSPEEDSIRSQRLEETLQSFKVPAKVRHVTHGPAISRFELELAAGIKVTKVTDLGKNIAMDMAVKSVRIEAPIPGTSLIGVEVPNNKVSTVTLREVLESQPMQEAKSPLVVALGKDIAGTPIVCDLARMPHLLIAGATGSGKSVCINTMINSLLYRCSPREVRMILVDPKVVELQCYNGIPHLLIPVVSDPHKASGALAWAVAEMMDRYKKFQVKGVRAIDGYNAKLEDGEEFMPRIVIIIDELADLMMTCKRDVEDHICRLAQLARAAGIHLVVATQRPSVDVITGLIKANIPSRIAFKVSSFIDSRTILDRVGAEQLLGWGDMLYLPTGAFTPVRVQGCFMSDNEVNRVTDFIRENCEAEYDPNIIEQLDQLEHENGGFPMVDSTESADDPNSDSSLLAQCIEMAVQDGQVSTSLLQRRLKVGYARAGRLVDEMEKRGIVSAKDGAKPRICLITREEFERMKENNELDE